MSSFADTISAQPYFENNKNRRGGFEYPFYAAEVETRREGYEVPPHWHYHMELLYFAEGTAEVFVGTRAVRAAEGDLLLVPPCGVHAVSVAPGHPSRHYVISFDPELLAPMPALFTAVKYVLPYSAGTRNYYSAALLQAYGLHDIRRLAEELLSEYERKEPAFELAVAAGIYRLLGSLVRAMPGMGLIGDDAERGRDGLRFRETLAYIDEHSHEPITASQVARISHMSYSHFAAGFKRIMHTPFSSYLHFVRVRKAERLLLDPERSITQIALETGFNHSSYFIKHFRRVRGLTPLQYRRAILGND